MNTIRFSRLPLTPIVALLGSVFAGSALADTSSVTIAGDMRAGVQMINGAAAEALIGPGSGAQTRVDGRSNLYFRGTEDLGNGNAAIFQVHTRFGTDGSGLDDQSFKGPNAGTNGTFGNQDTYVGLKGGWGMLRLGNDTSNMTDGKYDKSFVEGLDQNGGFFGGGAGANMVRYDTPAYGKLTASYQWWTGEDRKNGLSSSNNSNLRVDYGTASDPWSVGAGYIKKSNVKNSDGTLYGEASIWNATAGINFDNGFTLATEYQVNQFDPVGGPSKNVRNLGVYGYYTVGATTFGVQYGQSRDSLLDTKLTDTVLMAHYALSKRTVAYAEFLRKKPDSSAAQTLTVVGLSTSF